MAKGKMTYSELMKLAKAYGVDDNIMFTSAAERYDTQTEMIQKMRVQIEEEGLMVGHTNVKGDINYETHPLVGQIPKYVDTANKTLGVMLDIIQKLGCKTEKLGNGIELNLDEI